MNGLMLQADTGTEALELVQLLEHQRTLYRRLRVLAERQRALVMMDDAQPLVALLSERQRLVDGLVALSARMAPYRSRWTEIYSSMAEPARRNVSELLEEVNTSLSAILAGDRQDTATLCARRQDAAWRMSAMDAGSRAVSAYSSSASGPLNVTTDARC